jgi:hypothetical protein
MRRAPSMMSCTLLVTPFGVMLFGVELDLLPPARSVSSMARCMEPVTLSA